MSASTVLAGPSLEVDIWLQPKQEKLWELVDESPFTDIGYGGRRGGGKSGGIRRIHILRRLKYANTDGILLRRTRQELVDNHLIPLFREFPYMQKWWLEKDKALIFPNGSRLLFRYAEHEKDVDRLFGVEYADITAEEAGLFSKRELQKMKGSNRCVTNSQITAKTFNSFMPAGKSHFYLKEHYVDAASRPAGVAFIEAYGWDNVEWCRKLLEAEGLTDFDFYNWTEKARKDYFLRSDYAKKLLEIEDEELRQAWIEGNWDKFEGIVFPELNEQIHNLDNFQFPFTPKACKLISAVDWAQAGTTACTQSAIDPAENMFVFDEYAKRNRLISEHTAKIKEMLFEHGAQDYTLMDLPVHVLNQDDLFSIQREFQIAGLNCLQAHRAHIEMGINLLKEMLKVDPKRKHPFTGQMGSPRLFISKKKCPVLWKQMKELQREIDLETGKVKFVGEDDSLDTVRYQAMSRPQAPQAMPDFTPQAILQNAQQYTSIDAKVQRSSDKFFKTFGKTPSDNEWFPK